MAMVFIVLVIFIILGGIVFYNDWDGAFLGAAMGGVLGFIPSVLIGGIISLLIFGTTPIECKYTQDLVALKDNTSISGSFFLGCGSIDSEMNYVYAIETEKGITTVTLEQETNDIYIKYTDGQPYMEYWGSKEDPWRLPEESPYYVFYIPEGSLLNTYQIDLE